MTLDALRVDQVIRDAQRFKDLLDSPVFEVMMDLVDRQHYAEFRAAATPADLLKAQAKANVMDDVIAALRHVINTGEHDALERERTERLAETTRPDHAGVE